MEFRPEVTDITESPLVRIATVAEQVPGAYKLCYGESDMPTPEFICRAAAEAARAGQTFYTYPGGTNELRAAIGRYVGGLHGVNFDTSEIVATVGAGTAIFLAVRATVGPSDNAVIISPTYSIFASTVTMAGGEARHVPLARHGDRFELDMDRVRGAVDSGTRLLVVNSPSNPTGWVITRREQEILWQLALEHDLVILSDEVYERLVYDGTDAASSFASVATDREHLVVANSLSKSHNMTGWRLGWALAGERLTRLMTNAAEFITSSPAAMIQHAGIVALDDGEDYVSQVRQLYSARKDAVNERLTAIPGVSLAQPEGGFYAFFSVDGMEHSASFAEGLVRDHGVALAPGSAFGPGGEGHLRLCFASSEDILLPALDRIDESMRP